MTSGHYTDAEAQLGTTAATDSIGVSEQNHFPTEALNSTQSEAPTSRSVPHSSPSAAPESRSTEAQPARFLSDAQSSSGGMELIPENIIFDLFYFIDLMSFWTILVILLFVFFFLILFSKSHYHHILLCCYTSGSHHCCIHENVSTQIFFDFCEPCP